MKTVKTKELQHSDQIRAFERTFDTLNAELFGGTLPKPQITTAPTPCKDGTILAHFTMLQIWKGKDGSTHHEININPTHLDRPVADILATLVHEMVHLHCFSEGVRDTSKNGKYHNKLFKAKAEEAGLIVSRSEGRDYGFNITEPSERIKQIEADGQYDPLITAFVRTDPSAEGQDDNTETPTKPKSSKRRFICPACGQKADGHAKGTSLICGRCHTRSGEVIYMEKVG